MADEERKRRYRGGVAGRKCPRWTAEEERIIRAASILRASGKTPPTHPEPIELPQAGYAFRWTFQTGGEYVLVSNRMEDDQAKRFKGILQSTREPAPF